MQNHGGKPLPALRRQPKLLTAALAFVAAAVAIGGQGAANADTTDSKSTTESVADPQNEFLSAVVGSSGRFSEGAFPESADAYKIMYGWPSTDTSYTTVSVDGTASIFGGNGLTSGPTDTDANTNTASATIGPIETTQTIRLVTSTDTGRADTASITYTLHNSDNVSHSVGLRMMNDVDVNDNDGAPFRLPNLGAVTTDQDLHGTSIPDSFTVYQDLADSRHISAARVSGAGATAPDRLVIAPWPSLYSSNWDYTASGATITGDSAYALYWDPATLSPGQSRSVTTYYGLSDVTVDLTPPLALGLTGPSELSIAGNNYSPNPFTVTATVSDAGTATATNVTLTLNLPAGLHTASPNPVGVGDLLPGAGEAQASWSVVADPDSNPLTIATYSVTASATNATSKTVSRSVSRPALFLGDSYAALGDSYSSGEANPPFDAGTAVAGGDTCHRSSAAWPRLLDQLDTRLNLIAHLACSGATTPDITTSWFKTEAPQLSQLAAINAAPKVITITIGGNDIEFEPTLRACYLWLATDHGANCQQHLTRSLSLARTILPGRLSSTFAAVRAKFKSSRIVVVGYPQIFPAKYSWTNGAHCGWLTRWMLPQLNQVGAALESAESSAAKKAGVEFKSVSGVLAGHELCTGDPWLRSIQVNNREYSAHPLARGQAAIASAVAAYIR